MGAVLAVADGCLEANDLQTRFLAVSVADQRGHKPSTLLLAKYFDPQVTEPTLPPSSDNPDLRAAYDAYTRVINGDDEAAATEARPLRDGFCSYVRGREPDTARDIGC